MKLPTTFTAPEQNTILTMDIRRTTKEYLISLIRWSKKYPINTKPSEPVEFLDYRAPTWTPKPTELSDETKKLLEKENEKTYRFLELPCSPEINFKYLNTYIS